ncbi:MAG: hypothetical protein R2873_29480 [Caldilineaceae bacterium]
MTQTDFLCFRQIHLDFHTSEAIGGIGAAFDAEAWAEQLAAAHVDSITCFARCHHGWILLRYAETPRTPSPTLGTQSARGTDQRGSRRRHPCAFARPR